jgi:hypothetical protein
VLTDLSQAKYEIERFLCREPQWACVQNGIPAPTLGAKNLAVTLEFGKLIFNFWGDDFAESWRIDDYQLCPDRLGLDLSRQMGRMQIHLELRPDVDDQPPPADTRERRQRFQEQLCQVITRRFPQAKIEQAATQRDDARHLSGIYTRVLFSQAKEPVAAIGVNAQEQPREIDGVLTAGLIWFDRACQHRERKPKHLLLFAPREKAGNLARRLTAVRQSETRRIELYEVDEKTGDATFVRPFDQGSLFDPTKHRLPSADARLAPHAQRDRLLARYPDLIKVYQRPGSHVESLRLRGLEVARITGGKLRFGLGATKSTVSEDSTDLTRLIDEVAEIRRADSDQKWHPFYRQQAERWLEEIIREDVRTLDVQLNPRYVYPQIPAHRDDEFGMVDLLTITERGQLVIIELKVAEDVELPMQGFDYWLKVEWHRHRGDFQRRGYFPDIPIADESAALLLVSPLLRFHPTFDLVARWLDRRVPAYKIGINDNWRNGIKVLHKERVNG